MSIKRNTVWNLLGALVPLSIGLVSMPYLLSHIGVERLGILTIIWGLVGYFSLFDFGLGRALTQRIALLRSLQEYKSISMSIKSGLLLIFLTGVLGSLILFLLLSIWGVEWLNFSAFVSEDAQKALLYSIFVIPLVTVTAGLKGALEGFEDFKSANILKLILGVLNFSTPVLSTVVYGPSLTSIVVLLALSRSLILLMHIFAILPHEPKLFSRGFSETREMFKLFSFGAWMTLSNFLSPLMVIADRFVISAFLGASVVAYYTVPAEFLIRFLMIPAALTTALFPLFSKSIAANDLPTHTLYNTSLKLISVVMGAVMLTVIVFSHKALHLWLGDSFADSAYIVVIILSIGIFFNSLAQVPHTLLQGGGHVKLTALIHLFEAAIYAPALFFIVPKYGIEGVAVLWSFRALVDLILLLYFCKKVTGFPYATRA